MFYWVGILACGVAVLAVVALVGLMILAKRLPDEPNMHMLM